jgi:hypothetical protein
MGRYDSTRLRRRLAVHGFAALVIVCGSWLAIPPNALATTSTSLPAPDYSRPASWAAYLGVPSHADDVPSGMARTAASGTPVFFVHPTTYLAAVVGNASFESGSEIERRVDDAVLRFQASVFNGCCAIFAPRYRQASLHAITSNTPEAYAADELAYGDVARAFERFLQINSRGPFILASHSQGSIHALRLLQEHVIGKPLQSRLVAAYLIGLALPVQIEASGMPVCRGERATGCVISWNSVLRGHDDRRRKETAVIWWHGHYEPIAGRPLVCVNPLNWQLDGSAAPEANLGALYSAGRGEPLPAPIVGLTGAWCEDGLLGVAIPPPERKHFADVLTLGGIYHDFDYGLFYANIRANVALRVEAWKKGSDGGKREPASDQQVEAANAFLATLSEKQRLSVLYAFNDERQRQRWSNLPTPMVPRGGIGLKDMTPPQRTAAMVLLASMLSGRGLEKIQQIMEADEVNKINAETGRPGSRADLFGRDLYYLSILGTPSDQDPWMVQFGGHHLALNITVAGERGVLTPSLTGAQPAIYTSNGKTVRPLANESDKAIALLNALTPQQRQQAVLPYRVPNLVLGPGEDGKTIQPEGLKASALNERQRGMLLDLVAEWAGIIKESNAATRMAEIKAGLDDTWFAWSGATTVKPGSNITAYYRIQGPTVVIEYAPQGQGEAATLHVHTMYRDPTNDYGRKLTAQ